jgi:hypothetical protein
MAPKTIAIQKAEYILNKGCNINSNVDSPTIPIPSAVMVIPNWQAAKYSYIIISPNGFFRGDRVRYC